MTRVLEILVRMRTVNFDTDTLSSFPISSQLENKNSISCDTQSGILQELQDGANPRETQKIRRLDLLRRSEEVEAGSGVTSNIL